MTLTVWGFVWALLIGVADVPNPRARNGTWVSDVSGILDPATEQDLNRLIDELEQQTGVEMAVVTIPDTDGRTPKAFATALFNRWGIGKASATRPGVRVNTGVLFLVVINARRIEVEVGDGLTRELPDEDVTEILTTEVVPRFKRGDPQGGVRAGVERIAERLSPMREPSARARQEEPSARAQGERSDSRSESARGWGPRAPQEKTPEPEAEATSIVPLAESTGATEPPLSETVPRAVGGESGFLLLPAVAVAIAGGLGLSVWLRYRPRICPNCKVKMVRLEEKQDDRHLDAGQRLEERLGSVDYDVWYCFGCHGSQVVPHGRWFSGFHSCPECSRRTMSITDTTVTRATTYSSGEGRRDRECKHCSFADSSSYTIPRIREASSSSNRSSGSSSGSSGSSSSRSFGGGSSSGRGGGASW